MKCRSEYLEIFGYLNSQSTNSSSDGLNGVDRTGNTVWKSYHTWCGADRSTNHPPPQARYLISSNSLYMSLQTTATKLKERKFKIRYKGKKIPTTLSSSTLISSDRLTSRRRARMRERKRDCLKQNRLKQNFLRTAVSMEIEFSFPVSISGAGKCTSAV